MRYRQFGRTGLFVSELCLGTMTFGGRGRWTPIGALDQGAAEELIGRALDAGVNFIDTADVYSDGVSEQILGQALRSLGVKRTDVVIATKLNGETGPGPNDRGSSRAHIMDAIRASLDRLQLDHVDLYQIHGTDPFTPVEETVRALDDLVREGLIRYVGVSNWQAWRMMKALGVAEHRGLARFESVQAYYSIAGRDLERDIVPMVQDQGMGVLVWSPLAGGLLAGKYDRDVAGPEGSRRSSFDFPPVNRERAFACVDAMREVGEAHGVSVARIALAYVLSKPFVTSVIIGAKRIDQLEDNLAAADLILTADQIAKLDEISALPPEYPGWMVKQQAGNRTAAVQAKEAAPINRSATVRV